MPSAPGPERSRALSDVGTAATAQAVTADEEEEVVRAERPHGEAFSGRVGWGARPAVLVIDLVRAYTELDGPFALPTPGPAVAAAEQLVSAARAGGHPVIWTMVRYGPGLGDGGLFVRKVPQLEIYAEGAPGGWGRIVLDPAPGEVVVTKQYASAFSGTSLAATLTAAGLDTLVIAGFSTSGCVRATATDAIAHGIRAQVVATACADRSPEVHQNNLIDLDAKYADVIGCDEAIARVGRLARR